jgi:hypothetical protein
LLRKDLSTIEPDVVLALLLAKVFVIFLAGAVGAVYDRTPGGSPKTAGAFALFSSNEAAIPVRE